MAGSAVKGAGNMILGKKDMNGNRHGGLLGAARGTVHAKQNIGAISQGKAAAKQAGMKNFDAAAKSKDDGGTGGGYTAASGQYYSAEQLEGMKNGTSAQQAKYNELKNEAGDRVAKGFRKHAVGQWVRNAAYKTAMGEEKITDDQNVRFTGIGSQTAEADGKQQRTANAADMRNLARQAGAVWGGDKVRISNGQDLSRKLDFLQPPPSASSLDANMASSEPAKGDRADNGTDINYTM